jgi:hypothetical protein
VDFPRIRSKIPALIHTHTTGMKAMSHLRNLAAVILGFSLAFIPHATTAQQQQPDLNTILMQATFKLMGPAGGGKTSFGTVFLIGKPIKDVPGRSWNVMVTAAHVLNGVLGDEATLVLHHQNSDGTYRGEPIQIKIRDKGKPLYVTNPDADVAAMFINFDRSKGQGPDSLLPMTVLMTDDDLKGIEIHPGDELLCLGFPADVDFNSFPVIRSGILASYPLIPSKTVKTYYYNFHVIEGNSGGPVYFSFPIRHVGAIIRSGPIEGVIGLESQKATSKLPEYANTELDISVIVPSSFIIDTINMLPDSPSSP